MQKLTLGSSRSRGNRFPWSTVTSVRRSHRCYHLNPLKESAPSTHSSQDVMQMDRPRTRQLVWPTGAAPTCIGLETMSCQGALNYQIIIVRRCLCDAWCFHVTTWSQRKCCPSKPNAPRSKSSACTVTFSGMSLRCLHGELSRKMETTSSK